MTRFDPPGNLSDFDDNQRNAWSEWISQQLDDARDRDGVMDDELRPQPLLPLRAGARRDAVEKDISWTAFPRPIKIKSVTEKQRWRTADSSRDGQDEYCEWSVTRDPHTDRIVRVTFTSEGPEYWQFLAAANPQKVLAIYQACVDPSVKADDLFQNGQYVTRNRWNNSTTNGAMHLIQRNNTLRAEIERAAPRWCGLSTARKWNRNRN